MQGRFQLRPADADDARPCFDVFRRSLWDLLRRTGYLEADAPDPDLDAQWEGYRPLFAHLRACSARWWVAEDARSQILGYARSVEHDGLLELSEFFVAPGARVGGVGRALLEHVFPPGLGRHRSIIATLDAPAVALYLRFGVAHQSTGMSVSGTPRPGTLPDGYESAPATLDEVLALERDVLGHARQAALKFMLDDRPAVVLRHLGTPVGYAFLANSRGNVGPVAASEPEHLPAALAALESAAHDAGMESLDLSVPLAARTAVTWLLEERRFRVNPFYCLFLADANWAQLDRYLIFNPSLIL